MAIQNKKDNRSSVLKLLLLITNVVLIVYTMIFAFSYSRNIKEEKENQLKEKLFNNEYCHFTIKMQRMRSVTGIIQCLNTDRLTPSVISDSGGVSRSFSFPDPGYTCGSRLRWYRTRS